MKKIILMVLMLATFFSTYAKQAKHGKKTQGEELISIAMRHTACFGRCPDYSIEVNRNGTLTYTGIRFITDSGVYTKKIGTKKAMEIISQGVAMRLDTCKDHYQARVQDLPGIMFTIKYKTKTKTIFDANFGPAVLKELRDKMDGLTGVKVDETGTLQPLDNSWHKTAGSRK
jgi:hypothetical protein